MEDSRVNVPVSGTSFVDVYSAMSVAVGTKLSIHITWYEGEISSLN